MHVALIQKINERFVLREVTDEPAPVLDAARPLPEALEQLGVEVPDDLFGYLETLPAAVSAAIVSVAATAAGNGIPLTFAWLAGYDYELTVAQADRAGGSLITLILRGPSPSDVGGAVAATAEEAE
jgi:hypothetical protein